MSISNTDAPETHSEGFNIYVLPQVMAAGNIHKGIITGKLNGAIPAQIPKGYLYEVISIPVDIFGNVQPCNSEVKLVQYSTTSIPLYTSPLASCKVFPYSSVMILTKESILAFSKV